MTKYLVQCIRSSYRWFLTIDDRARGIRVSSETIMQHSIYDHSGIEQALKDIHKKYRCKELRTNSPDVHAFAGSWFERLK